MTCQLGAVVGPSDHRVSAVERCARLRGPNRSDIGALGLGHDASRIVADLAT